ncbi:MAG: hypothetical protein ACETWG_05685 [Candidatus Neomarinimicrobiota bacterium]
MRLEPHTSINLVAENEQDEATLQAFIDRCSEARVEYGNHLFRDHELIIYLPTKQHPEYRAAPTKPEYLEAIQEEEQSSD